MADVEINSECNPKELFGQGIRAFTLQDFENAVAALSKASELFVADYKDDLHDSLAEVYLYYGRALLGLSREQNEALGEAVPKNSAEESEDDEEPDEAESSGDTEAVPSSSEAKDEQKNGDECDDEASDLQLAWEVLELAKNIFQRLDDKKSLADTLIVLGEVSLESENFESAINDIKQGLEIQKDLFAQDSRTVAETLYKLGVAYSTNSQIDEAIDSFNQSLEYLRNRIKTLEQMKIMTQEHKDEVVEINGLIPDIEDKIADMKVYKEEAIKKVAEAINEPSKAIQNGASSSKEVTNISHLVKRKRKLDEAEDKPENEEAPAKKPAV